MKRLGVLNCGQPPAEVRAQHGGYIPWFTALLAPHGFDLVPYDVANMDFPEGPEAADAWLITGSPFGVYEPHPFIAPLEALIRQIIAAEKPLVGICFGHQIIAQAMGGHCEKYAGGWGFGRKAYQIDGMGEVFLNAYHQDQVLQPPPGAEVIASNDFTVCAGFRLGPSCVTLQPHPEITSQIMATYLGSKKTADKVPPALVAEATAALDRPTDESRIGAWLAGVLAGETATVG